VAFGCAFVVAVGVGTGLGLGDGCADAIATAATHVMRKAAMAAEIIRPRISRGYDRAKAPTFVV